MSYFEVLVSIKTETQGRKGETNIKTIKETYLVDAMTVTEAEARVVKDFVKSGFSNDYNVEGAKKSKIAGVIHLDPPVKSVLKNAKELPNEKDEFADATHDNENE